MIKYLSVLFFFIFFIYKYHGTRKNAAFPQKKCTFSRIWQEKAHKKNLHTNRLAYAEEKIKRKYIICVSYLKAVAACCT